MFEPYKPFDVEFDVLDNWEFLKPSRLLDLNTAKDQLTLLVRSIYQFDHFWDYSDDPSVRRAWGKKEDAIMRSIKSLEDKETHDVLLDSFRNQDNSLLIERFPWVKYIHKGSPWVTLVGEHNLSYHDAGLVVGARDWINQLTKKISNVVGYSKDYPIKWITSNNYPIASELMRIDKIQLPAANGELFNVTPLTVSDELLSQLDELSGFIRENKLIAYLKEYLFDFEYVGYERVIKLYLTHGVALIKT